MKRVRVSAVLASVVLLASGAFAQPLSDCSAVTDDEAQAFDERYLVYTVDPSGDHDMVELYEESNGVPGRQGERCSAPDGSEVDADRRETAAIFLTHD